MPRILQNALPIEMQTNPGLPGVAPCDPLDWLRRDEAYAAQMAYREALLSRSDVDVLAARGDGAEREVLQEALTVLPGLGFRISGGGVTCPDGRRVTLDEDAALKTLGHLVQQDICVLQKQGPQHVLTGAVLCFPANWRLAEKLGKPLTAIHDPVDEYDANIAARVQRLFDGVKLGRPLWRFNKLSYARAELHSPSKAETGGGMPYLRAERQCLVRMPKTQAVIFTIHSFVVKKDAPQPS